MPDTFTSHPEFKSFDAVPPRKDLRLDEFTLPDGSPMTGPDGFLVPEARSFSMILNAASRVYSYRFDEAMYNNQVQARAMRRDAFILGLLEERILPTINRRWQIEVPDAADPNQRFVQDQLTKIIDAIPDFDAYKRALLDGVWFGRAGVQQTYQRVEELDNRWGVAKWDPIHGDSVQFTFDGVPAILMDSMTAGWYTARGATVGQWGDVRPTDRGGMALVLQKPYWRDRFVIHQHIRQKADYFEGVLAGSVQGLGLRGQVYWQYVVRTEALTWMLAYMQSVGQMDMLIFNYPWGNHEAKMQQQANANQIIGKAAFIVPRNPTGNWPAVEQLSMNDAGLKALHDLVSDYFDRHIERLIVGQSMSAGGGGPGGLEGDGRADFARATKDEIIVYDTNRLDSVLTRDLIKPLVRYNFKWAKFPIKFKSVLPNLEAEKKVMNGQTLIMSGVPIKVDEFREAAGYSRPEEGDEIVGGAPPMLPGMDPMMGGDPSMGGGMPPGGDPMMGGMGMLPAGPTDAGIPGPPMAFSGGGNLPVKYQDGPTRYTRVSEQDVAAFVDQHHAGDQNALNSLRDLFDDTGDVRGDIMRRHAENRPSGNTPTAMPVAIFDIGHVRSPHGGQGLAFYPWGGSHTAPPAVLATWSHVKQNENWNQPDYVGERYRYVSRHGYFTPDEAREMADRMTPEQSAHLHKVLDAHFGPRQTNYEGGAPAGGGYFPGGSNTYLPKWEEDEQYPKFTRYSDVGPAFNAEFVKLANGLNAPDAEHFAGQNHFGYLKTLARGDDELAHDAATHLLWGNEGSSPLCEGYDPNRPLWDRFRGQAKHLIPRLATMRDRGSRNPNAAQTFTDVGVFTPEGETMDVPESSQVISPETQAQDARRERRRLLGVERSARNRALNPEKHRAANNLRGANTRAANAQLSDEQIVGNILQHVEKRGEAPMTDLIRFLKTPAAKIRQAVEWGRQRGMLSAKPVRVGKFGPPRLVIGKAEGNQYSRPEAPTSYKDGPHKFCCVYAELKGEAAIRLRGMAKLIPDELLCEEEGGREESPHVTVLYGLHEGCEESVKRICAGIGPVRMKLGKISVFPAPEGKEYDVLKAEVESSDLRRLNYRLKALPYTSSFPKYVPHATIAYVKKGEGEKLAAGLKALDVACECGEVVFSGTDNAKTVISTTEIVQYGRGSRAARSGK